MSKFMKVLAVLALVVGLVAGIALGTMHQTLIPPKLPSQDAARGFNWELMLSTWAYAFVLFGVLYSIASALDMLAQIVINTTPKREIVEKVAREGFLLCKKCGEENPHFVTECQSCGARMV